MTTVTDDSPATERLARMEGAYQHLATKADLYKALFLFALGQTALQVSVIVLILRVLR